MIGFGENRKTQMAQQQDDTPALISAALEDPAAFGMLYDRYVQHIYRYAYSRVENTRVAEDVTSQTFMAAYESLGRYRERGYFSACAIKSKALGLLSISAKALSSLR